MALDVVSLQFNSSPHYEASKRASTPQEVEEKTVSASDEGMPEDLRAMARDLQRVGEAFNTRLSFSINEKLGSVVVKVIDNDTDKVVREIPPTELQRCYERIREVLGLLFDKSA